MKNLIVEFSGWCKIDAASARFIRCEDPEETISGEEWMLLSEIESEDYVLECLIQTLIDCDDNDWSHTDVFEEVSTLL